MNLLVYLLVLLAPAAGGPPAPFGESVGHWVADLARDYLPPAASAPTIAASAQTPFAAAFLEAAVALEPDLRVLPFAFTADRLEVELAWPSKLSATLERPELVFIDFFDTPTTDYTPILAYIEKLQVEEGAIRFQDHGENGELQEWIAIEGVA